MVQVVALLLIANSAVESRRIPLEAFPCGRIAGVAREGDKWLVGGIRGLYLGKPNGDWKRASNQSVREMRTGSSGTWILFGNGALDKVDIRADRLYDDLLRGVSKRPWVSSFSMDHDSLLLGGAGGWIQRGPNGIDEHYLQELSVKPVTAITKSGSNLFLGTQDGLYCQSSKSLQRFGFASGMPDLWVTAMIPSTKGIVAGVASGGLVVVTNGKVERLTCPTERVRSLTRWKGALVVGALDGAWMRRGENWERLCETEATFLSQIGKEFVIGTPEGLRFYRRKG